MSNLQIKYKFLGQDSNEQKDVFNNGRIKY